MMLSRFSAASDERTAAHAAKACALYPSAVSVEELELADQLADKVIASGASSPWLPWHYLTKGWVEYRLGHFAGTAQFMKRLQDEDKTKDLTRDARQADSYLLLAMANHQLKQPDEAREALARGREIAQTKLPKLDGGDLGMSWFDNLMTYILLREAKETIEGKSAGAQK
jgi:hypothetical protein